MYWLWILIAIAFVAFLIFLYLWLFYTAQPHPNEPRHVINQGNQCTTGADCPPNHACMNGKCVRHGHDCQHNRDCMSDEKCVKQRCIHVQCTNDYECPANERCIRSRCMNDKDPCIQNEVDCGTMGACGDDNKCHKIQCTHDEDCPTTNLQHAGCINGTCTLLLQHCSADNECPNHLICTRSRSRGTCVQCDDTHSCPYGSTCNSEGRCVVNNEE